MSKISRSITRLVLAGAVVAVAFTAAERPISAHDAKHFSAGEPGDAKKPFTVVLVTMREGDGKMYFIPDRLTIRRGEQVKFFLTNIGHLDHEFVIGTGDDNKKHAELMMKYPDMVHDDPNGKAVKTKQKSELLWRFTKSGEFEFACLIPGHYQAGMYGKIVVK